MDSRTTTARRPPVRLAAAAALAACGVAGAAQERYACVVSPSSTFTQATLISLPLAGTWIGNYDAVANPAGTRTIPGLFGGSGNNAIPFTSTVKPTARVADTVPAGGFSLVVDRAAGTCAVESLSLDVLNGQAGTLDTDLVVSFSTFRTVAPSSTFIGVSNLTVPLEAGSLTAATAAQSGPAVGTAAPNADGTWAFAVTVPAVVSVSGTSMGQPFSSGSPGALVLAGTLSFGPGGVTVSSSGSVNETVPVDAPPPIVNQPFPLPTILPPGGTANLLMSGTFSPGTATTTASASLAAAGKLVPRTGDLNADGSVNGADLGILLGAWGAADPGEPADLNADGVVDGIDLGILLGNWG
jgi:hypothetical protein